MAIARKAKKTADDYAEELKQLILRGVPDAEFVLHKRSAREYDLDVYGNFNEMWPVFRLLGDRPTDILLESGIHIHVLPLGRRPNYDS
jgi:hypothetical protein